jgi:hypothetical protein
MKYIRCIGVFIPQYRSQKHTQKNPFYLSIKDATLAEVNTTDEFITTLVHYEVESICESCRSPHCKGLENGQRSKKENGL